jgi:hypothetical protein
MEPWAIIIFIDLSDWAAFRASFPALWRTSSLSGHLRTAELKDLTGILYGLLTLDFPVVLKSNLSIKYMPD